MYMEICCSDESSCLLTNNGDLYVWGRNTNGMFDGDFFQFALDFIKESLFNSAAALIQSGPAFVFSFIEGMA